MTAPTETLSLPAGDAPGESGESRLAAALEEFQKRCESGAAPDIEAFAQDHPDVAAELAACLGNLALIRDLADSLPRLSADGDGPQIGVLGDYRLIREIGRGGMGVVYEAEQISLGRRVALKVLPFAAVLDPRHLQRFKNEAMAAAHLDHPHIVEVYGVGCERGIHFYAMRYVEGVTLAEVIDARRDVQREELSVESRESDGPGSRVEGQGPEGLDTAATRRMPEGAKAAAKRRKKIARGETPGEERPHSIQSPERATETGPARDVEFPASAAPAGLDDVLSGRIPGAGAPGYSPPPVPGESDSRSNVNDKSPTSRSSSQSPASYTGDPAAAETERALQAALSTVNSAAGKQRFRRIAELGIQAAEALDHAHQMGIVHRDVKPSNLMLDERGKLWVTDFGLARSAGDPSMTMTGDLVGTLRYMSPEQALAKRVTLDHRTDIYSLGVTLYELLTLRPAVTGDDREETLRQIAFDDPTPPRKLDKSIPAELETIVLKAMEKTPDDRYSTARELSEDLARYLDHKPIAARRPTILDRTRKWTRRHASLVFITVAALAVVAAIGITAALFSLNAYRSETEERMRAEGNILLAADSIDRMLTRVGAEKLERGDLAHAEALTADATEFYETLLQRSNDPELRFRAARAFGHVSRIWSRLKNPEKAKQVRERTQAILESLIAAHPERSEYVVALADNYAELGHIELFRVKSPYGVNHSQKKVAEGLYRRSLEIMRDLVRRFPDEPDYEAMLAQSLLNLANVHYSAGSELAGLQFIEEAEAIFERLPSRRTTSIPGFTSQDILLNSIAQMFVQQGDVDAAEEVLGDALTPLTDETSLSDPSAAVSGYPLHRTRMTMHLLAGRHEAAAAAVEEMIAAIPDTLQAHLDGAMTLIRCAEAASEGVPESSTARSENEPAQTTVGEKYRDRARELVAQADNTTIRPPEVVQNFARFLLTCPDRTVRDPQKALPLAEFGVEQRPDRSEGWFTLALAHYRNGDPGKAYQALQRSYDLANHGDGTTEDRLLLSMICFHMDGGQQRELAEKFYAKAHDEIIQAEWGMALSRELAAEAAELINSGDAQATQQGNDVAGNDRDRRKPSLVPIRPGRGEPRDERMDAAINYYDRGTQFVRSGDTTEAIMDLTKAELLLTGLVEELGEDEEHLKNLAMCRYNLAAAHLYANERTAAVQWWERALSAWQELADRYPDNSEYHSRVGATLSSLAIHARDDNQQPAEALSLSRRAIEHQLQARSLEPRYARCDEFLCQHYDQLTLTLFEMGDHAAIAEAMAEYVEVDHNPVQLRVNAAYNLMRCADLAADDDRLDAEQRAALARQYLDQSGLFLRAAGRQSVLDPGAWSVLTKLAKSLKQRQEQLRGEKKDADVVPVGTEEEEEEEERINCNGSNTDQSMSSVE